MTALPERQVLVEMVNQANRTGARLAAACEEAGMSVRTFERWTLEGEGRVDARPGFVIYGRPFLSSTLCGLGSQVEDCSHISGLLLASLSRWP